MSKYRAKRTKVGEIEFPSKLEAERYKQLILMLQAGVISRLKLQEEFVINRPYQDPLTGEKMRAVVYRADFTYLDHESKRLIAEDTKGIETPVFKNKWRQVKELYPEYEFRLLKRENV